jgi:hypothetical protein
MSIFLAVIKKNLNPVKIRQSQMRIGLPALFCTPGLGPLEFTWISAEHYRAFQALASTEP